MQQVRLELDSNVRRVDNGTALLGGSPFRLVRLSAAGSRLLDRWLAGEDVSSSEDADELRQRLLRAGMVHPVPIGDGELPPVAFVVPVFEDAAGLDELLTALRREHTSERVVVVDDASGDGDTIAGVASRHNAELMRHATNQGPAAARNTGWKSVVHSPGQCTTRPEVIVFVDADVVPKAGAVHTMLTHFSDPDVSVVAPRVRAAPGQGGLASYEANNSPLDLGPDAALVFPRTRISYVPSAALGIRTAVIEGADGFEMSMRFGEDVDLIWRLIGDGHVVRYVPSAVVEHRTRPSMAAFARQRFSYGSSAAALADRHGSKVAPLQMPATVVVPTLAMLFGDCKVRLVAVVAAAVGIRSLATKLEGKVDSPRAEGARLAAMSHRYALHGLAAAATRSWAPLLLVARQPRRALIAALMVPAILDWIRTRPATNPIAHIMLRAADHGAYCAGVWAGALRLRSVAALLPSVRFAERLDD